MNGGAGLTPQVVALLAEQRSFLFAEGVHSEYVFATSTGERPPDSFKPVLLPSPRGALERAASVEGQASQEADTRPTGRRDGPVGTQACRRRYENENLRERPARTARDRIGVDAARPGGSPLPVLGAVRAHGRGVVSGVQSPETAPAVAASSASIAAPGSLPSVAAFLYGLAGPRR